MFSKFVARRIIDSLITYSIIIFMYSAVLNTSLESTVHGDIAAMTRDFISMIDMTKHTPEDVPQLKEEYKKSLEHHYGLDQPSIIRILHRTYRTLTFDFGESASQITVGRSRMVHDIILEALPLTLLLFVTSSIFSTFLGIAVGIRKARFSGTLYDKSTSILTMIFFGAPAWWVGSFMIIIFGFKLGWFPLGSLQSTPPKEGLMHYFDILHHLALPVITMIFVRFWGTAYLVKNMIMVPLQEDFVMAARGRGIPERKVLKKHAFKTAMPAIMTMGVLTVVTSIAGDLPLENVFSWPGLGTVMWKALLYNDIPLMMGILTLITILYMSALFLLDIIYGILDPRIRVGAPAN